MPIIPSSPNDVDGRPIDMDMAESDDMRAREVEEREEYEWLCTLVQALSRDVAVPPLVVLGEDRSVSLFSLDRHSGS